MGGRLLGIKKILIFVVVSLFLSFSIMLVLFIPTAICDSDWSPDLILSCEDGYNSYSPSVAVAGNYIHVVWSDEKDGNFEIYYKSSYDGGETWNPDIRLTYTKESSFNPSITVNGSNIHVVWKEYGGEIGHEVHYKRSRDNGMSWDSEMGFSIWSHSPKIAVEGDNVHVVYCCGLGGHYISEIGYRHSTNNGLTWGSDIIISDEDGNNSWQPTIAVENNNVYIAWSDYIEAYGSIGYSDIYYRNSSDGGISWCPKKMLSNVDETFSETPEITVKNNTVHLVWCDFEDDGINRKIVSSMICYRNSLNGGISWEPTTILNHIEESSSENPKIAVNENNIHVVWADERDGTWDIFYKKSPENGVSWDPTEKLSNVTGNSKYPAIGTNDNNAHILWHAWINENYEIHYIHTFSSINQPPIVNITSPTYGWIINGTITISGTSFDIDGLIDFVQIKIDNGTWQNATGTTEWSYVWDTTEYPNGEYIILARAFDGINCSVIESVTVIVNNIIDSDGDGDKYPDDIDAFPNDSTQWLDRDNDRYGDNLTGNNPDMFPDDPTEWNDTDGDSIGDNADLDDDNDGIPDDEDDYPYDPSRYEVKKAGEETNWVLIIGAIMAIIIIIVAIILIGRKKQQDY